MTEPAGPPAGRNVISFSLWGPAPFYSYGAMINLVLSRNVYPGWSCRFYVDSTVPPACTAFLRDHGCTWAGRTDCGIDIVELMRRYFTDGPNAKYGHDQRMLGLLLWPLIRNRCLVHDKYYRLAGVATRPLPDPKSHFGAGHQNIKAVLAEVEALGIPRVL
jgi:hypothetical protein